MLQTFILAMVALVFFFLFLENQCTNAMYIWLEQGSHLGIEGQKVAAREPKHGDFQRIADFFQGGRSPKDNRRKNVHDDANKTDDECHCYLRMYANVFDEWG